MLQALEQHTSTMSLPWPGTSFCPHDQSGQPSAALWALEILYGSWQQSTSSGMPSAWPGVAIHPDDNQNLLPQTWTITAAFAAAHLPGRVLGLARHVIALFPMTTHIRCYGLRQGFERAKQRTSSGVSLVWPGMSYSFRSFFTFPSSAFPSTSGNAWVAQACADAYTVPTDVLRRTCGAATLRSDRPSLLQGVGRWAGCGAHLWLPCRPSDWPPPSALPLSARQQDEQLSWLCASMLSEGAVSGGPPDHVKTAERGCVACGPS